METAPHQYRRCYITYQTYIIRGVPCSFGHPPLLQTRTMKLFQLQVILSCVCSAAPTLAFSTHYGYRHASFRAKISPYPHQSPLITTQRRRGAPLKMSWETASTDHSSTNDYPRSLVDDTLAGLTVAFSMLSKAIACSAIVGVNPLVGIWSSVVMGITAPLSKLLL